MDLTIILIFVICFSLVLAWFSLHLLKKNENLEDDLEQCSRSRAKADFYATLYSYVLQALEDQGVEVRPVLEKVKEDMLRHVEEDHEYV